MVVVASFSKVCIFSENDPSTRTSTISLRFQIFPLWRLFSKVSFEWKRSSLLIVFVDDAG